VESPGQQPPEGATYSKYYATDGNLIIVHSPVREKQRKEREREISWNQDIIKINNKSGACLINARFVYTTNIEIQFTAIWHK